MGILNDSVDCVGTGSDDNGDNDGVYGDLVGDNGDPVNDNGDNDDVLAILFMILMVILLMIMAILLMIMVNFLYLSNQLTPKWIVPRGSQRKPPTLKRSFHKSL